MKHVFIRLTFLISILAQFSPITSLIQEPCFGSDGHCQQKYNAICSPKTLTCICPLGYQDSGSYCTQTYCSANQEARCDLYPNTHCHDSACQCKPEFYLDAGTQKCEAKIALNSECSDDFQCGANAVCSKDLKRCICPSSEFTPLKVNCLPNHCESSDNCTSTLGHHSECTQNEECACKGDYAQGAHTDQCVYKYRLIGENCTQHAGCGQNAFCLKFEGNQVGFCACKLAHKKLNKYHCQEFSCYEDKQCNSTWGFFDTHCNVTAHRCACLEGLAVGASGRCEILKSTGFAAKSYEIFSFVSLLFGIVLLSLM